MTILFAIWWWLSGTPAVDVLQSWNTAGLALVACLAIDAIGLVVMVRARGSGAYLHALDRTWTPGEGWRSDRSDEAASNGRYRN